MKTKFMVLTLLFCLGITLLLSVNNRANAINKSQPPTVVSSLDLNRYQGEWYEVASIPMFFQRKCAGQVKVAYTVLENQRVDVLNQCETTQGKTITAHGQARLTRAGEPGKLEVSFLKLWGLGWRYFPVSGAYWVIALADDYSYAVVGHPKREYGWILSRTPALSKETLQTIQEGLIQQGYDTSRFLMTSQKTGVSFPERPRLNDYLQQR
jgi:apolipoprotein D and lipocalin family protein